MCNERKSDKFKEMKQENRQQWKFINEKENILKRNVKKDKIGEIKNIKNENEKEIKARRKRKDK